MADDPKDTEKDNAPDEQAAQEPSGYQLTAADCVAICQAKGARLVEFTDVDNATEDKPIGTVTLELPNLRTVTFAAASIKGATQDAVRTALAGKIAKASK